MSDETNLFGGKAKNALYFPMSEDEQETISRIIEAKETIPQVTLVGPFGEVNPVVDDFRMKHGDSRVQVDLFLKFETPVIWVPVHLAKLSLFYKERLLFSEEQSLIYGGQAESVGQGKTLALRWDIQIKKINPELVKLVKPGSIGLTSRVGNTHYNEETNRVLNDLRNSQEKVKQLTKKEILKAKTKIKESK